MSVPRVSCRLSGEAAYPPRLVANADHPQGRDLDVRAVEGSIPMGRGGASGDPAVPCWDAPWTLEESEMEGDETAREDRRREYDGRREGRRSGEGTQLVTFFFRGAQTYESLSTLRERLSSPTLACA